MKFVKAANLQHKCKHLFDKKPTSIIVMIFIYMAFSER